MGKEERGKSTIPVKVEEIRWGVGEVIIEGAHLALSTLPPQHKGDGYTIKETRAGVLVVVFDISLGQYDTFLIDSQQQQITEARILGDLRQATEEHVNTGDTDP